VVQPPALGGASVHENLDDDDRAARLRLWGAHTQGATGTQPLLITNPCLGSPEPTAAMLQANDDVKKFLRETFQVDQVQVQ
jgi:hypothetical protein